MTPQLGSCHILLFPHRRANGGKRHGVEPQQSLREEPGDQGDLQTGEGEKRQQTERYVYKVAKIFWS